MMWLKAALADPAYMISPSLAGAGHRAGRPSKDRILTEPNQIAAKSHRWGRRGPSPGAVPAAPKGFDRVRLTFGQAIGAAQADAFWRTPVARAEPWDDFLDLFRP